MRGWIAAAVVFLITSSHMATCPSNYFQNAQYSLPPSYRPVAVNSKRGAITVGPVDCSDSFTLNAGKYTFPKQTNPNYGVFFDRVQYADVNADGQQEAIVSLDWEVGGGILSELLLYIYDCSGVAPRLLFSAAFEEGADIAVKEGRVVLAAPVWRSDDPHCCPSYEASIALRHDSGGFTFEVTALEKLQRPN